MTFHISQFEIVPVTEANARLTADGMNYPYQRWIRASDYEDRKLGYILYYSAGCHDGHWYRTKTEAKMARQELVRERLHKAMERALHDKQDD